MRSSFAKISAKNPPVIRIFFIALLVITVAVSAVKASGSEQELDPFARKTIKEAKRNLRKGKSAEAEQSLRELVAKQPANAFAKLNLAYVLLKEKRLREAYDISFDVVKKDPTNAYGFAVLGNVLIAEGNLRQARLLVVNALKLDKKEGLAWAGLGLVDFYENRIDVAIENLEMAAYLEPRESDFHFALAQVAARAERYEMAALAYEKFLDVAPTADRDRRERIEGLIRFLRFLGGRKSLYDIDGKRTTVPISIVSDRPVIGTQVNGGKETLKFVLDTGSGISVISRKTAERLGIKPITKGGMARAIGGTGKFPIVYGFLNSVTIGDVKIRNVPVYIREFYATSEEVDGYIGLALISKFLTTLDYGEGTFTLAEKSVGDGTPFDEAMFLPLRLTSSGFLSGEVMLEGVENPLNFIVDTGASVSVISSEVAALDEIGRHARDERLRVIGAAGVLDDVRYFVLPKMSFGENSVESVRAVELDLGIINEASGFRQAGILGGNFLKNYRLVFDFKNSKVVFKANK